MGKEGESGVEKIWEDEWEVGLAEERKDLRKRSRTWRSIVE